MLASINGSSSVCFTKLIDPVYKITFHVPYPSIFDSFAGVYGGLYVPLDDPSPLVVTTTTNIYYTAILLIDRIVFYIWLFIIC